MIGALNVDKLRLETGDFILSVQAMTKRAMPGGRLAHVDLDARRGSVVALIGPAGSGKSLTFACITGARRPTRGRVRYFGYELRGRAQERIAKLGLVRTHQQPRAFGAMTVFETVLVGALVRRPRLSRAQAHAREILAHSGLVDRADATFAQLDEIDRRRLELARALATDPQVLLVDDCAAGLEPSAAAELGTILGTAHERGVTIVMAARSLDACPLRADSIVEIHAGATTLGDTFAAVDLRL